MDRLRHLYRHLPGPRGPGARSPPRTGAVPRPCPATDDALLVASELASNAIVHSASQARFFTVRAELHADHVRIEVEDLGGPWCRRRDDDRPHGLDVVEALTGPGGWGIEIASGGCRIVWAQLSLATAGLCPE